MNQSAESIPEIQGSGEVLAQSGQVIVEIITEFAETEPGVELLEITTDEPEIISEEHDFAPATATAQVQITDLPADLPGLNLEYTELEFVTEDTSTVPVPAPTPAPPHRETTAASFERSAGRRAA